MRRRFLRAVAVNLAVALMTLMAFAFFLEVGFRIVTRQATLTPRSRESAGIRPCVLTGWENTPGTSGLLVRDEFTLEVKTNSQGLRDREHSRDRRPGVPRAVVIGDSFAWGAGVNLEQRFDEILEREYFPGAEFINFGVIAYGTDQEYVTLRERALAYNPDLVLLVFFAGNDVLDNVTPIKNAMRKPLFEVRDGKLVQTNEPITTELVGLSRSWRLHLFLRDHLVSYRFFSLRYERSRLRFQLADKTTLSAYLEVYRRELTPRMARGWPVTEALLAEMKRLSEASGAGFAVVVVPAAEQVDESVWARAQKDYHLSGDEYDLELPNRRLSAWGRAQGVPVLDLLPGLRAGQRRGEPMYYPFDGHLTPAGSDLMAREMAGWLRDLGFGARPAGAGGG